MYRKFRSYFKGCFEKNYLKKLPASPTAVVTQRLGDDENISMHDWPLDVVTALFA